MSEVIKFVEDQLKKDISDYPEFSVGDTITVYYRIVEGEKVRIQPFRGIVLERRGSGATETFTVRKVTSNVGIERVFPLHSPHIDHIVIHKRGKVRRSRIFYIRHLKGRKASRIKERRV